MSAQDLARTILRSDEWMTGTYKKIRLLICHSGTKPKNGESIRDQLQKALRGAADVEAPDSRVGINDKGQPVAVADGKGNRVTGPAVFIPAPK
jgi:hypothetical protein